MEKEFNFYSHFYKLRLKTQSILPSLLLTYLQYQGYIKFIKSKSNNIESLGDNLIAYIDLKHAKTTSKCLKHEELEDLKNGILLYALVSTTPEAAPLFATISKAISYIT